MCPRCQTEPPLHLERKCAFHDDKTFNPDNWRCETIKALLEHHRCNETIYGCDFSVDVIGAANNPNLTADQATTILAELNDAGFQYTTNSTINTNLINTAKLTIQRNRALADPATAIQTL